MFKRLLAFLIIAVSFSGCTKEPNQVNSVDSAGLLIEGLHDLILLTDSGKDDTAILINVYQTSGRADEVTFSTANLPAGVKAEFSPVKGVPPFSTELKLTKVSSTKSGDYSVTVNAVSASFNKSGTLTLTIPDLNGWTFDGVDYSQNFWGIDTAMSGDYFMFDIRTSKTLRPAVFVWWKGLPPQADGTYNYKIVSRGVGALDEVVVEYVESGVVRHFAQTSSIQYATLRVQSGKFSLNIPPIEMYKENQTDSPKIFSMNASQR